LKNIWHASCAIGVCSRITEDQRSIMPW
jgi:hypothetical protein